MKKNIAAQSPPQTESELLSAEAADINEAHCLAHTSAADAVRHAVRCGELLRAEDNLFEAEDFLLWAAAQEHPEATP